MTMQFIDIVIIISLLFGGAVFGWILSSLTKPLSQERLDRRHRNALHYMREGNQLRHTVIDFIKLARHERMPTNKNWHDLVEAILHEGTPESIKQEYHRLCGTVLEEE